MAKGLCDKAARDAADGIAKHVQCSKAAGGAECVAVGVSTFKKVAHEWGPYQLDSFWKTELQCEYDIQVKCEKRIY